MANLLLVGPPNALLLEGETKDNADLGEPVSKRSRLLHHRSSSPSSTNLTSTRKKKRYDVPRTGFPKFAPTVESFAAIRVMAYFRVDVSSMASLPRQTHWYFPLFLDMAVLTQSAVDPCELNPNSPEQIEVRRKLYIRERNQFYSGTKLFTSLFYPRRACSGNTQVLNATILTQQILQQWIRRCEPDYWYMQRPGYLRMVNPVRLTKDALVWLFEVLEFQFVYRWDIYLRNFKFPISASVHDSPWWNRLRNYYKYRSSHVKSTALKLRLRGDQLVDLGYLPRLIWYDPALFFFHDEVLQLLPLDYHQDSFVEAMRIAYEEEPARSYWVNKPYQHPFYQLGLQHIYPDKFAVPWRPVFDPCTGVTDVGYLSFLHDEGGVAKYSGSAFPNNLPPEERLQLGLDHFVNLGTRVRSQCPDVIMPSVVPPQRPDPTAAQIAAFAIPTTTLDTPMVASKNPRVGGSVSDPALVVDSESKNNPGSNPRVSGTKETQPPASSPTSTLSLAAEPKQNPSPSRQSAARSREAKVTPSSSGAKYMSEFEEIFGSSESDD